MKDLDVAVESYWRIAGIGPWNIFTTGAPPLICLYHGQPANYKIRLATARSGSLQMELIEYISGDTIHRDFLASGRVGIEHVGIYVPDLEQALQPYQDRNIDILQQADGMGMDRRWKLRLPGHRVDFRHHSGIDPEFFATHST